MSIIKKTKTIPKTQSERNVKSARKKADRGCHRLFVWLSVEETKEFIQIIKARKFSGASEAIRKLINEALEEIIE